MNDFIKKTQPFSVGLHLAIYGPISLKLGVVIEIIELCNLIPDG